MHYTSLVKYYKYYKNANKNHEPGAMHKSEDVRTNGQTDKRTKPHIDLGAPGNNMLFMQVHIKTGLCNVGHGTEIFQ